MFQIDPGSRSQSGGLGIIGQAIDADGQTHLIKIDITGLLDGIDNIYRPQLLKQIKSVEDRLIKDTETEIVNRLTFSQKTMALVHQGLYKVVNGEKGTARCSKFPGLSISGKTGTGQVISRKEDEGEEELEKPDHLKAHAWFVAFAPAENPRIAVAVVVEHGEHGSGAAAPIAREMLKTYMLNDRQKPEAKMMAKKGRRMP